jgi:hypothetical protein
MISPLVRKTIKNVMLQKGENNDETNDENRNLKPTKDLCQEVREGFPDETSSFFFRK